MDDKPKRKNATGAGRPRIAPQVDSFEFLLPLDVKKQFIIMAKRRKKQYSGMIRHAIMETYGTELAAIAAENG